MKSVEPADAREEGASRIARQLIERARFVDAERLLEDSLDDSPSKRERIDLLYALAVARRCIGKTEAAFEALNELIKLQPDFGRAHQEKGHLLLAEQQLDAARKAYGQAVTYNSALLASWRALAKLSEFAGDHRVVEQAEERVEYLSGLPPELLSVANFIEEGRLFKADQLCRHFLRRHKQHVEGMRLLAKVLEELDILPDAEFLLETAIAIAPDHDAARYDFANLLLRMQKFERAHEQTSKLVKSAPDNAAFLALHAGAASGIGDYARAVDLYNRVIERHPEHERPYVMRGHAQKTMGAIADAVASYRTACALRRDYGDAYWSLANTKTYRFEEAEIEQMKAAEIAAVTAEEDRIHLCFALGKALEDKATEARALEDGATDGGASGSGAPDDGAVENGRQRFAESFAYYERGNALRARTVTQGAHVKERVDELIAVCNRDLFDGLFEDAPHTGEPAQGCDARDPIFIVGLPRAGSTLLEQILASHSMIDGTGELPHVIALAGRLHHGGTDSGGYPSILRRLSHDHPRRFGEQFIEQTRIYRRDAPLFIDKNPNNFFHVGLIKLMLPNARVIDARRHPMACCFSGFKQLFGQGQAFSYGLRLMGHYYQQYVRLMDHWDEVLPGFVLRVQHEDVVDDLEGQVRRLLDFLGLPFEEACLNFHLTERDVRTPSSEQVRRPIYREGLDAWKHYETWLDPLKEALGPEVRECYGIDFD